MPPYDPTLQPPPGQPLPPEELPPEDQLAPDESQGVPTDELPPTAEDASPEEQAQKDQFVGRAMELIYSDKVFPQVVQMLEGGASDQPDPETGETAEGDPVQGLAAATTMIVSRVAEVAEQKGAAISPDVLYHAGADILEELAEVSKRGQIKDYSQDHDALEQAWFTALDMYRNQMQQNGTLDQESAKGGLDQLQKADANGSLERIMRNLAANEGAGQAGGEELPPEPANQNRRAKGFASAMGGV
jgi:hypothetical protein